MGGWRDGGVLRQGGLVDEEVWGGEGVVVVEEVEEGGLGCDCVGECPLAGFVFVVRLFGCGG